MKNTTFGNFKYFIPNSKIGNLHCGKTDKFKV